MQIERRHFLGGLATLAASGAIAGSSAFAAKGRSMFKKLGKPIGLQLYTLGDEPGKDLDGVFAKLASIGYRDLELPSLFGKTPAVLRAAADKAGVKFSAIHLAAMEGMAGGPGALSMVSPTQKIVDDLGTLGVKAGVMPIFAIPASFRDAPGASFQEKIAYAVAGEGVDMWKRTAALLNEKGAALKSSGIAVGYHNHNNEFAPVGGTTGWDILTKETDSNLVHFEVDVGWVAAAGLDPVAFLKKYSGRCKWMHVKDVKSSTVTNYALKMDPTEVGSGKQDWVRILPAARKAGVEHFYVEQEPPFTMSRMDAAVKSYAFLAGLKG